MTAVTVRTATSEDLEVIVPMWRSLFPEDDESTARKEIAGELASPEAGAVLIAEDAAGAALGFAHVGLRHDYVPGCTTSPVGYLEAWFVLEQERRKHVGGQLVEAAEAWARVQGCTQLGSDCLLDNDVSFAAHSSLGFEEVERLIAFRKSLEAAPGT